MSDPTVLAAKAGDQKAFSILAEEAEPRLRATIGQLPPRLSPRVSVEDILQETYVRALIGVARLRGDTRTVFICWINEIARTTTDQVTRDLTTAKAGGKATQVDLTASAFEGMTVDSSTPSKHVARLELNKELETSIAQLRAPYREILRLRILQGQSLEAVSMLMGSSEGAVSMLQRRALDELRTLLSPD